MDEQKSKMIARTTLCRTISGNRCDLLTITNNKIPGECDKKRCIILTARVHPGETNSSFMMEGVIDFLLSDCSDAEKLRSKFIFKIIPMLNVDGVIHGNSRCDLSGVDLNRRWKYPSETLHPTIFHAKKLINEINNRYKIAFFCDFHGHSKK
jgi:murein tripeptide amidase MpaA